MNRRDRNGQMKTVYKAFVQKIQAEPNGVAIFLFCVVVVSTAW